MISRWIKTGFLFAGLGVALLPLGGCASSNAFEVGATSSINNYARVKRGRATTIAKFVHWNKNCWAQSVPRVTILTRPKLGVASARRASVTIDRSECRGIPLNGAVITYRGKRRGKDTFKYRVSSGPNAGVHTMRVTVK